MRYSDSFIQELTERSDIVDVISGYVKLTKRSGSNLFGLCPFHNEKTPSFSVAPDRQIYKCFGCGKGGSVIGFIMEAESLSFGEAVEFLAKRAGMQLPDNDGGEVSGRRERLLSLNRDAARFFNDCLVRGGSVRAREYVEKRGISPAMVTSFGLGCAPDSWEELTRAMRQRGYTTEELVASGLARVGKSGGIYDYFRDRLMFPVIDVRGSVIGFSGRILGDGEPKYLNSPETPVFNKGRCLFALNLAKKSKSGYIILTEGNVDVVSLHQAGFDSAVASLGTSLTAEQGRLISRFADSVVIAYDNDEAGHKAAQRAIGILEKLELNVKVLRMSGAKDPDELIKSKGPDAFAALLRGSEGHMDYLLDNLKSKSDLTTDEGRVGFLKDAAELIAALPGAVEREVYGARAAEAVGVSREAVAAEIARRRKQLAGKARRETERRDTRPTRTMQPPDRELRLENPRTALAEQGVIKLLFDDPSLAEKTEGLAAEDFQNHTLGRFYGELLRRSKAAEPVSVALLQSDFTTQEISLLTDIIRKPTDMSRSDKALSDYIARIKAEKAKTETADFFTAFEEFKKKKGQGG